ncbi:hypothetical protein [Oceanobacillus salinisoli]|uniref:hypothetical protein n=1 Tax=Oceanobacillus salinisoli TaxID=2678611 RepID=UPI0018CC6159|nr:hypothetical protein [Oceanobacillus salinisoli]
MMKKYVLVLSALVIMMAMGALEVDPAKAVQRDVTKMDELEHNWVEYSVDYNEVDGGTHEYTYWKNFIKRTRTCHKTHIIKTVVYYCDKHDHTKSETFLDETIHSHRHGK